MITPPEKRIEVLLDLGVPRAFLAALENLESVGQLRFCIAKPEGAYFYLPQIAERYEVLAGWDITPIYDGSNGDVFYVHLARGNESRFVHFELEQDEIYDDHGGNFQSMLADLLIDYYEFDDEASVAELAAVGESLGFVNPAGLFAALEEADEADARSSFESDARWREAVLLEIIAAAS